MKDATHSRRVFIRNTSLIVTGTVASVLNGQSQAYENSGSAEDEKILNYNPHMKYRRLGKTNLMIGEISIGGHWNNRTGGRGWGQVAKGELPEDVGKNRTEVISACIDHGMNYLDITTAFECLSYGVALKGRREKMYVAADDSSLCPRHPEYCNVQSQLKNIDSCLHHLKTDYLDVWRPQFRQDGKHEDKDIELCIAAFEKAHAAGKARWLGMSSHNRTFIQHLVEKYPQYSMVVFPYMAKSKVKPAGIKAIDPEQIIEIGTGDRAYNGDTTGSIFSSIQKNDIGVITIKPFGGGSLFRTKLKFGEQMESTENDYERARLTLAYILCNPAISATVPGVTTITQVKNNLRASEERLSLLDQNGIWKLCDSTNEMWASLPEEYTWLKDWEWV